MKAGIFNMMDKIKEKDLGNQTINYFGSMANQKERVDKHLDTLKKGMGFGDMKGNFKLGDNINAMLKKAAEK